MHILAADVWFSRRFFQIFHNFGRFRIHSALHITDPVKFPVPEYPFVMNQSGRISLAEELTHCQNILPCIGFITAGPNQNRGMVFIPLQHGTCPVHNRLLPFRQRSRYIPGRFPCTQLLPGAMTLQIRLINQIDSIFITQFIPAALIRIMGSSHCIDIILFQNSDIGKHILFRDRSAPLRIKFMPVDAPEENSFSIQAHDPINHLKIAESHRLIDDFQKCVITVPDFQLDPVQIGNLC